MEETLSWSLLYQQELKVEKLKRKKLVIRAIGGMVSQKIQIHEILQRFIGGYRG